MRRGARFLETALDLVARHRAVARVIAGLPCLDSLNDGPADFHRSGPKLLLDGVRAVVTGAPLDDFDRGVRNELEHVARLQADVLHAQVTGNVITHLAERGAEVRAQEPRAMAQHQV